jgi:hypothetical protein
MCVFWFIPRTHKLCRHTIRGASTTLHRCIRRYFLFQSMSVISIFVPLYFGLLVVRTGFEPVGKCHIRFDLLLRLRNLKERLPIPPPDYKKKDLITIALITIPVKTPVKYATKYHNLLIFINVILIPYT